MKILIVTDWNGDINEHFLYENVIKKVQYNV